MQQHLLLSRHTPTAVGSLLTAPAMKRLPLSIVGVALVSVMTACGDPSATSSRGTEAPSSSSPATSSHMAEISDYARAHTPQISTQICLPPLVAVLTTWSGCVALTRRTIRRGEAEDLAPLALPMRQQGLNLGDQLNPAGVGP